MKFRNFRKDTEVAMQAESSDSMKNRIGAATATHDGILLKEDFARFDAKADKPYVDQRVSDLINGAPANLDTLKEIADKLANEDSAIASLVNTIAQKEPANVNIQQHISTISGNPHGTKTGDVTESNDKLFSSSGEKTAWNGKQDKISSTEVFATADFSFTAGAFADVLSLNLTAGKWLVIANLSIKSPLNLGQRVSAKIWDGTTVYTSAESSNGALGVGLAAWSNIALSALVTLTGNRTIKVSAASSAASILSATVGDYSTGTTNTANSMRAIKFA